MLISSWMQESGVTFGTSGARGRVDEMSDRLCFAFVLGYLAWMQELGEFKPGDRVALAGDLRASTPRILRACQAAVTEAGGVAVLFGDIPTPCLCYTAFAEKIPSLMVTGSHIPADRNGIKFNRSDSEFSKEDEKGMLKQDVMPPDRLFDASGALVHPPVLPEMHDVTAAYIDRYRAFFGAEALQDIRLGVYQHMSVARDLMVALIEALGGTAIPFGRSETFHAIDTEALPPETVQLFRDFARDQEVTGIISTDGDADRPILTDQFGDVIRGDTLGLITACSLKACSVATPISSNTALERCGRVPEITRTKIGSPYVLSALRKSICGGSGLAVGYEANGGFILGSRVVSEERSLSALPTRDFALPILCTLVAARNAHFNLQKLIASLPHRICVSDRLEDTPTASSVALIAELTSAALKGKLSALLEIKATLSDLDKTDGTRLVFSSGDIVHLRPSGNAPELRIYTESATEEQADALLQVTKTWVRDWLSKKSG